MILSKKKLLIISGSGATCEFGTPSVKDIHEFFIGLAKNDFSFSSEPSLEQNLYSFISTQPMKLLNSIISSTTMNVKELNFEDFFFTISLLQMTYSRGINTSPLAAFIKRDMPDKIWQYGAEKEINEFVLHRLASYLVDGLLNDIRTKCIYVNKCYPKIKYFYNFFNELNNNFELSVVNINYDNLTYSALPELETGFDLYNNGSFNQRLIINRKKWGCHLHLHGSVHFNTKHHKGDLGRIFWEKDINSHFRSSSLDYGAITSNEKISHPFSTIIAGYDKMGQMRRDPFMTYYSKLLRLVSQSDALLFLGYGFGDEHINSCIAEYRDERKRPIVMIDYAVDNMLTAGSGTDNLLSIRKALALFKTHHSSMVACGKNYPSNVEELKKENEFERSSNKQLPLSIWYKGMEAACFNPQKIIGELSEGYKSAHKC